MTELFEQLISLLLLVSPQPGLAGEQEIKISVDQMLPSHVFDIFKIISCHSYSQNLKHFSGAFDSDVFFAGVGGVDGYDVTRWHLRIIFAKPSS